VTINICEPYRFDWNEMDLKNPTSINWRKSLVPAPAVIPAGDRIIQFAAVKKLVVGWGMKGRRRRGTGSGSFLSIYGE
jgi:hypothetical protein